MINYRTIPNNFSYRFGSGIRRYVKANPNYFALWGGYNPDNQEMYEETQEDLPTMGVSNQEVETSKIEGYFERTLLPFERNAFFLDIMDIDEPYIDELFSRCALLPIRKSIDKQRVDLLAHNNGKKDVEIAIQSMKKENLFTLHHAIYDAGRMQDELGMVPRMPINVNVFPKSMQTAVTMLCESIFECKKTHGKDFDFLSIVDKKLGRGQVIIFADIEELHVPTINETYSFDQLQYALKKAEKGSITESEISSSIRDKEYDSQGYCFFDISYGMRVVMAAIKAIREGRINNIDELVSYHSIKEVIEKYPVLTEVATNPELFKEKFDEIKTIVNILQGEYDFRNYNNIDREYTSGIYKQKEEDFLTPEEIEYRARHTEKVVQAPKVESLLGEKMQEMSDDFIIDFLEKLEKNAQNNDESDYNSFIKGIMDSRQFKLFPMYYVRNIKLDYQKIDGKNQHIGFIKDLRNIDINTIDYEDLYKIVISGIDTKTFANGVLETIKFSTISALYMCRQKLKALEQMKNANNNYSENEYLGEQASIYYELLTTLLAIRLSTCNSKLMSTEIAFDKSNYFLPPQYRSDTRYYEWYNSLKEEQKELADRNHFYKWQETIQEKSESTHTR